MNYGFLLIKVFKQSYMDEKTLCALQKKLIQSIVKHAYYNVPYYRKIWKKARIDISSIKSLQDLKKLPLINKDILRKNYTDFIADNYPKDDIIKALRKTRLKISTQYVYNYGHPTLISINGYKFYALFSSGTTGPSLPILYDKKAWRYAECIYLRAFLQGGYNPLKSMLYHWSTPFRKRWYNYFGLIRKIQIFPTFSESKQIQLLKEIKPRFIFYPPSSLYFLCKKLTKNKTHLKLKSIFTSGEVLTQSMRDVIESRFKAPIYDHYSASEFDYIAWQCKRREFYHINSDALILEVLDSNGDNVIDTPGRIVITGLFNYLMPLIRYEIGDIGAVVKDRCKCGSSFPLIKGIYGRTSKLVKLNSGKIIFPKELINEVAKVQEIEKFRIIYTGKNKFIIKIIVNEKYNPNEILKAIRFRFERLIQENFEIEIQQVKNISKEKSGKVNLLKIENAN